MGLSRLRRFSARRITALNNASALDKLVTTLGQIDNDTIRLDIAGGMVAGERAQGRVATVAVDAMKFIRPVKVGDVLCVYCDVVRVGRTSIAVEIEAWVKRDRIGSREKVTEALFTFVALDTDGKAREVSAS